MGLRPVCEVQFIDFIACCFDMLTNFAAKSRYRNGAGVPIVVRGPCGGGVGGGPFHSLNAESFFLNTPGLKMVEPSTAYDAKGLLKAAIRDDDPVLVIENLPIYKQKGEVPLDPDFVTPIGRARIARPGTDLTIVAHSYAVVRALEVAERLAETHGASIEVVDLRSLRPLDVDTVVESVARTNRALCIEEGWASYGVTAELTARIQKACFDSLDAPVERVGMAEVPLPYAKGLEHAAMPNEDRIAAAALATIGIS
jgi:pyruvate/2-oxoglutarate/acetoin dehydrogenase E1 component